jgi:steroid delta-isomerase-like uncharacterized protein
MSIDANKAIVRRYYDEVLNGRRPDLLDELAATDHIEHDPLPGQGEGLEGFKRRVGTLVDALASVFDVEDLIAEGDRVVVRWTNTGTHVGEFFGAPPTGRAFRMAGIDIHRISDGKLAEHWHVVDQFALMLQLGLLALPEPASS